MYMYVCARRQFIYSMLELYERCKQKQKTLTHTHACVDAHSHVVKHCRHVELWRRRQTCSPCPVSRWHELWRSSSWNHHRRARKHIFFVWPTTRVPFVHLSMFCDLPLSVAPISGVTVTAAHMYVGCYELRLVHWMWCTNLCAQMSYFLRTFHCSSAADMGGWSDLLCMMCVQESIFTGLIHRFCEWVCTHVACRQVCENVSPEYM